MSAETVPVSERLEAQRRVQREKNQGALDLLKEWLAEEGDPHNDAEVWEKVKVGLNEGRRAGRSLFND